MSEITYKRSSSAKKILKAPFIIKNYGTVAERFLLKRQYQCKAPQLFIVGLPRTGTTLIYQYIVHRLNVSYFTYGVGRYPYAPCITSFIQHKSHGQYKSTFESNYGRDSSVAAVAPREAGEWWCRFFDIDNYMKVGDVSDTNIHLLQNTVACIQTIFGGTPFINKNVKHLLRIEAMSRIFPNSKFLVVERGMGEVAISILRGRYKNLSDPSQWWSVRPPNYMKLRNLSINEQIANQCISLRQKMEIDLSHLPPDRVLRVHYEDFCKNPEGFIRKIISSLNATMPCFEMSREYPANQEESDLKELVGKLNSG